MNNNGPKFYFDKASRSGVFLTEDNLLVTFEEGAIISVGPNPYKDGKLPIHLIEFKPQSQGSD